jgi:hypothetical protein
MFNIFHHGVMTLPYMTPFKPKIKNFPFYGSKAQATVEKKLSFATCLMQLQMSYVSKICYMTTKFIWMGSMGQP